MIPQNVIHFLQPPALRDNEKCAAMMADSLRWGGLAFMGHAEFLKEIFIAQATFAAKKIGHFIADFRNAGLVGLV